MKEGIYIVETYVAGGHVVNLRNYFTSKEKADDFAEYCNLIYEDTYSEVVELYNEDNANYRIRCDSIYKGEELKECYHEFLQLEYNDN